MIPIYLEKPPREIPNHIVAEKEELTFATSVVYRDGRKQIFQDKPKNFRDSNFLSHPTFILSIRRHLRSNKYSLHFKLINFYYKYKVGFVMINGITYSNEELSEYKMGKNYTINPDSGLKGFSGEMKKLSSIVMVCNSILEKDKKIIFKVNMDYHKNTENKKIEISDKAIDLLSVNNSNLVLSYNEDRDLFRAEKWNLYNHLIIQPLPMRKRIIDDLYNIYSYNDSIDDSKSQPRYYSRISDQVFQGLSHFYKIWSEDTSINRDIEYHGGVLDGLKANGKTKMSTWVERKKITDAFQGTIKIKNESYYDFKKKQTIIEPNLQSQSGYIFPLNQKGMLNTKLKFEPNAAYKDLEIYRQYKIENKVLDIYEGLVSMSISNPNKLSSKPTKTMIFSQNSFKKIILNDLSLKSLERISDK